MRAFGGRNRGHRAAPDEARARLEQAVSLLRQRRLDEAERLYRAVRPGQEGFPLALHHLGVIALQRRRAAHAEKLIRRSLALAPDVPDALSNLGLALGAQGRLDEASECFRRAILVRPGYTEAHYNLGVALDAAGERERAVEAYGQALALNPRYAEALANRAMCLHVLGRPAEAAEGYRAALALAPGMSRLHGYLGRALAQQGRLAEGRALLQRAASLLPDDPEAALALADLLYDEGDVVAATDALAEALSRLVRQPPLPRQASPTAPKRYPVALYPEALRSVAERLAAGGIEAFLTGGTLLGLVRDGGFLSFDKDVDLGVEAGVTPADLLAAFRDDPEFSPMYGAEADAVLTGFWFRGKVAVDFFRFFRQGAQVWCGVPVNGHLVKWLHRPFRLVGARLGDVAVMVPEDSEGFLAEVYGAGWRRPDPYFGLFASPNIEGGFPQICRCLAYGAIARAGIRRERERLESLCRQVLALEPGEPVALAVQAWLEEAPTGRGAAAGSSEAGSSEAGAEASLAQALGHPFDELPG